MAARVVYARAARARGEKITAAISLETIGCYSDEEGTGHYHGRTDTVDRIDYDRRTRVVMGMVPVIEDLVTPRWPACSSSSP